MKILRARVIDWEPLTITLVGSGLDDKRIERFDRSWLPEASSPRVSDYC